MFLKSNMPSRNLLAGCGLVLLAYVGLWCYFSQFDENTTWDIIMTLAYGHPPIYQLYGYLIPALVGFFSPWFTPLGTLIGLAALALGFSLLLWALLLEKLTTTSWSLLILGLMCVSVAFRIPIRQLDDNFYQIPFIMLSIYVFWKFPITWTSVTVSLFSMTLAIMCHYQIFSNLPVLALAMLFKPNDKRQILWAKNLLKVGVNLVVMLILLGSSLLYVKQNLIPNSLAINKVSQQFSVFTLCHSWQDLIAWTKEFIIGVIVLLSPFQVRQVSLETVGSLNTVLFTISCLWTLLVVFFTLWAALKAKQITQDASMRLVLWINLGIFLGSALFDFIYDTVNSERWVSGVFNVYLNSGVGLYHFLKKYSWGQKSLCVLSTSRLKRGAFASVVITVVLILSVPNLIYLSLIDPKEDFLKNPNVNILSEIRIVEKLPSNSILLMPAISWLMISYYHADLSCFSNLSFCNLQGRIHKLSLADVNEALHKKNPIVAHSNARNLIDLQLVNAHWEPFFSIRQTNLLGRSWEMPFYQLSLNQP